MKEKLYTIPLNDAVNAEDECPFCFVERKLEQDALDFVLGSGSSYMEADVRDITDKFGFCRNHWAKMFAYGNTLGNGWILKTHYMRTIEAMKKEFKAYSPVKIGFKGRIGKDNPGNNVSAWAEERNCSCYICNQLTETYERYMDTFFVMYKKDEDFRNRISNSKGFCISHFGDLCKMAEKEIPDKEKEAFFSSMFELMEKNMDRMFDDVAWLVEKFDYRNKDADWKNSKDAVQRGMQKLKGGYPADALYKMQK